MKIYTRRGDAGQTDLFGGSRVSKNALRIEALGDVDEINAYLGVVRSETPAAEVDTVLERIQNDLFRAGAALATVEAPRSGAMNVGDEDVKQLEDAIDRFQDRLTPLAHFILPGGTVSAAHLHLARAVCRRAERRVVALIEQSGQEALQYVLRYLNRLSDLLFVLARLANALAGRDDVIWAGRKGS